MNICNMNMHNDREMKQIYVMVIRNDVAMRVVLWMNNIRQQKSNKMFLSENTYLLNFLNVI